MRAEARSASHAMIVSIPARTCSMKGGGSQRRLWRLQFERLKLDSGLSSL